MRAMVLERPGASLELRDLPIPEIGAGEILLRVECCAVCRTDLHVVDGELADPKLPLIPGHQVVGIVEKSHSDAFRAGDRAGVPWMASTCGECAYCASGRENLCDRALFTGYTRDGGFAEYVAADERFALHIPRSYSPAEAAPLLCGGLIGFRAYRMCGEARRIAFYGFGSSAQILAQIAAADGREVYAFTRANDRAAQQLALSKGAVWSGSATDAPPHAMDAAIVFAPEGSLVVTALRAVARGGVVVCAGIHMSDIPSFPYSLLWGERTIRSVANLTRDDGRELFDRIASLRIETQRASYLLEDANEALAALRSGAFAGTAVLEISR